MRTPEFSLDWPHGWQTRDEREVKILAKDLPGLFPICAAYPSENGDYWECECFTGTGHIDCHPGGKPIDVPFIINKPAPKRELWVNVYSDWVSGPWSSREQADDGVFPSSKRIACVKITEGDGL